MGAIASQITSLTIVVYSTVYSDADKKKPSKLRVTGLCVGNSPGPVNSPHKWPVTRKMFPFDDVIMCTDYIVWCHYNAVNFLPNSSQQTPHSSPMCTNDIFHIFYFKISELLPIYLESILAYSSKAGNKANLRDLIAATGLVISNWIQIVNFSARVIVKFNGWPRKPIGHFFYPTSSFMHHFKSIGEFKLDLQSRKAQFGSKLVICYPEWPWNLMDDLGKQ